MLHVVPSSLILTTHFSTSLLEYYLFLQRPWWWEFGERAQKWCFFILWSVIIEQNFKEENNGAQEHAYSEAGTG